jgi:hypothetical protein
VLLVRLPVRGDTGPAASLEDGGQLVERDPRIAHQGMARAFAASRPVTLMATKRTSGSCQAVQLAVVKSDSRVPTAMTTSASRAMALPADPPVAPTAPIRSG